MKRPVLKLAGGVAILALLSFLFFGYLLFSNTVVNGLHTMTAKTAEQNALNRSVSRAREFLDMAEKSTLDRFREKVQMDSIAYGLQWMADGEKQTGRFYDGAVIRIPEDEAEDVEGLPETMKINPGDITGESGFAEGKNNSDPETEESDGCVVCYFRIDGPFYYIEWKSNDEMVEEREAFFDFDKCVRGIEKAFGVDFLMILPYANENGKHDLLYHSDNLPGYDTAEDYGISKNAIANASSVAGSGSTASSGSGSGAAADTEADSDEMTSSGSDSPPSEADLSVYNMVVIDDDMYELSMQKFDSSELNGSFVLAYLTPFANTGILYELAYIILAAFIVIGIVILVWYFSILLLVRDYRLNETQKKEFTPGVIRRRYFSIIAVGCVVIAVAYALFLSLFRLSDTCHRVSESLLALKWRIEDSKSQEKELKATQKHNYEDFAVRVARLLEDEPLLISEGTLQIFSDIVGADYIMLFDEKGKETISNSVYTDLTLGTDPSSSTFDFRRLLNGVPVITHESTTDEVTGLDDVLIGVSLSVDDIEKKHRALLLAMPKEKIHDSGVESTGDIIASLGSGEMLTFSVDPETGLIKEASDGTLKGRSVTELGLPKDALVNGYRDFFTLDGLHYYGECEEIDGILYYCAAVQAHIYEFVPQYSLITAALCGILMSAMALFMLFGYKKHFITWSEVGEILKEPVEEDARAGKKKWKYSVDPSERWKRTINKYGHYTPYHNALSACQLLLMICIVVMGFRVISTHSHDGARSSIISFILEGNWAKGVNLFAFSSILILLGEVFLVVILVKLFLRLISNASGTKGETICRLLINLTNYCGILIFVYYSLFYLGFKPNTLLASLGLLSFAISLGAKDLITDVIAGLSIVFEGEYQVGDIIEVNGYRGEVLEIGVRTTKLEGRGGNIKIIGNRDVKNVLNMTRKNSWYPLEINVSFDQPLGEIEKLLADNLPGIGASIPEIVSGPFYKGIVSVGKGTITLSIIAECNEGDYYVVQRSLNRAVTELFEDNGVKMF